MTFPPLPSARSASATDHPLPPLGAGRASEVRLVLRHDGLRQPMRPLDGGWHEVVAAAGARRALSFALRRRPEVPDPASRCQAETVHGPSLVVDPGTLRWRRRGLAGRPWHEAVLYELHVGTFTPEGTFAGGEQRLPTWPSSASRRSS